MWRSPRQYRTVMPSPHEPNGILGRGAGNRNCLRSLFLTSTKSSSPEVTEKDLLFEGEVQNIWSSYFSVSGYTLKNLCCNSLVLVGSLHCFSIAIIKQCRRITASWRCVVVASTYKNHRLFLSNLDFFLFVFVFRALQTWHYMMSCKRRPDSWGGGGERDGD